MSAAPTPTQSLGRPLVMWPSEKLSTKADPVATGEWPQFLGPPDIESIAELAFEMLRLMVSHGHPNEQTGHMVPAAGLAAPQIGVMLRVIILNDRPGQIVHPSYPVLINPEIVGVGRETETADEGCLSIPGVWLPVERARVVTVRAIDLTGRLTEFTYKGKIARAAQHEIDHLDGVTIIDRSTSEVAERLRRVPGDLAELARDRDASRYLARFEEGGPE